MTCRRCESALEPGWQLESVTLGRKYNSTEIEPTMWVSGEAEPRTDQWGSAEGGGFASEGRTVTETVAYRCTSCGLLEIYARPVQERYVRP